ncbi:MAG: glycerate kinase [Thermoleophilia bacterium]|nr:glycerate kinase [Thermoleophilia bacterium]
MRVVCCPDKLKGSLPAADAAAALAAGVRRIPGLEADELPLADGGEGTAAALLAALGGEWRAARVADPLGREVEARFALLADGRAVVESAEAIGLSRLDASEFDPLRADSAGLGQLLLAAAAGGAREILVTLGGSATVDGGSGLRRTLTGRGLAGVRLRAACDVTNPLLGELGAARVFGPQKGATPGQVEELERRLAAMPELQPHRDRPGAGAAGGLGAALAALGADLVPGARLVLDAVGFPQRIAGAALAVTGEGRVDETSAAGKLPGAVAAACAAAGVPCVVFGGAVRGGVAALHELGATAVLPLGGGPGRSRADLEALGEALGRLLAALRR